MDSRENGRIKIGEIERFRLHPLLESGKIPQREIENLQDENYCKETFRLFVPMLTKYHGKNKYRYYVAPLTIHGVEYLLTNDWYEDENRHQLEPLMSFISKYKGQYAGAAIRRQEENAGAGLAASGQLEKVA